MPCDQVRTTTTEWSEATDLALVQKAMIELGFERVRIERGRVMGFDVEQERDVWLEAGRLSSRQSYGSEEYNAAPLKQRYAAEVVKDRFTALGWNVEEQGKAKAVAGFTREW
jgi:hypothetical protein